MSHSPEDDIPIPSEPVLSEEETAKQLRADFVRQYTDRILILESKNKELQHLLRQVFYARSPLGTKFCDELDRWKLDDLHERILEALGDL